MAKKPNTVNKVKIETIVQLPLMPDDGMIIKAIATNPDELMLAICEYAEDGWSFSLSKNSGRNGFSVFVGQTDPNAPDKGYGFYANGNTPMAAYACAFFKLQKKENRFLSDYGSNSPDDVEFS